MEHLAVGRARRTTGPNAGELGRRKCDPSLAVAGDDALKSLPFLVDVVAPRLDD